MLIELSVSDAFTLRSILAMVANGDTDGLDNVVDAAGNLFVIVTDEIMNETAPKS